jgi:Co/Zn/Cd efflux system component
MTSEWSRFIDQHPKIVSFLMLVALIAIVANVVMAFTHHWG